MERLMQILKQVDDLAFTYNQKCIELLDNRLQDILIELVLLGHNTSGEIIELKKCSWTLHERWYMDTEEQLKWTFHHCKHRILKNTYVILQSKKLNAA